MKPSDLGGLLGAVAPSVAFAACVIMLLGCGDRRLPRRPVSGSVQVDGEPAGGAVVVLHPVVGSVRSEAEKIRPTGTCDRDGRFVLGTWELADGVPPGRWKATVQWFTAAGADAGKDPEISDTEKDRLGNLYGDPETTPLVVEVGDTAVALRPFQLRTSARRQ